MGTAPANPSWRIGLGFLIALGGLSARAETPWLLPAATARFEMQITSRPTVPDAGIVAVVPDSGILPKGKLKVDVVDSAGKALKANLLWHNPNEGLALVFEDTAAPQVSIYATTSPDYPKSAVRLNPSVLLFVRNGGKPSLEQAHDLADKMLVGPDIYFAVVDRIFHSVSPVGRDDQTSSYYSGWFQVKKPGKTYFYTCSKDGSEFYIDGKQAYSWPGLHGREGGKRAEKGAWIDMSAGVHRIEYYHFAQSFSFRECQLGWQQAGEPQPKDAKNPNLPNRNVTGPMKDSDFVHSGMTALTAASSKQGPLAIVSNVWEAIIQPGESPVCLFQFYAFGSESLPANTVYEWDFGGERKLKGPQATWLFGGVGDHQVSLTVSLGTGKSTCTKVFFPKSMDPLREPPRLSINRAEDRRKVRDIYLAMCRATPADRRPAELWNATLWEGLIAVLDPQTDYALLSELVQRSRQDVLNLDTARRWLFEDAFFDVLRQTDPKLAATWLDRFEKEEKDPARRGVWMARRVEFNIFEADNLDQARLAANEFTGAAAGLQQTELAMIRMGDVELYSGHQDLAQRFYAQAQEFGSRQPKPAAPAAAPAPDTKPGAAKPETGGPATGAADKKSGHPPAGRTAPAAAAMAAALPSVDAWKVSAVHASAYYSTVRSLIGQQAYIEARKMLGQWELELPLDKLAGEFPLAEAEYYLMLKQFKRAQKILKTYRQSVDLSNTLPQAMKMELYCLTQLDRDKDARELAALIIKRLPNHPLADEVKELLAATPADGKLTVDVDLWSQDWTSSERVESSGLAGLFGTNKVGGIKKKPPSR